MIALDSNVFIYVLDKDPAFVAPARDALNRAAQEPAVISTLVYAESLARYNGKLFDEARRFIDLMCERAQIKIVDLNTDVAVTAAKLRATHKLKTPDAIHVATALSQGASTFITNDLSLTKLSIKGLRVSSF